MITVYIRRPDPANPVTGYTRYYRASVSEKWLQRHDNGATRSCGLTVGTDLDEPSMKVLINLKQADLVT